MKALNTVKITFPSRSVNEGFARSALSAFAAQADPTLDELADVKTAVSEAVTNCIVHAYANTIGPITLTAALYEDCPGQRHARYAEQAPGHSLSRSLYILYRE